jgi:hypothetical protein
MDLVWGALGMALLLTFLWGAQHFRGSGTGLAGETRFAELAQLRQLGAELEKLSQTWERVFAEHTGKLADLETAVDHGIRQVTRQENRIRGVVRRAREELADGGVVYPALEAEAAELRYVDGEGGPAPELPTVPAGVDQDRRAALKSLPGAWNEEDFVAMGI